MAKARMAKFVIALEIPKGVPHVEMLKYIEDSIKTRVGDLDPNDLLFDLDCEKIKVTTFRRSPSHRCLSSSCPRR